MQLYIQKIIRMIVAIIGKTKGTKLELINESYLLGTAWVSMSQYHTAFAVGDNDIVLEYAY